MQQVQLTDQLYRHVARNAAEAGFDCVDEYVADVLALTTSEAGIRGDDRLPAFEALRERVQFLCASDTAFAELLRRPLEPEDPQHELLDRFRAREFRG